MFIAQTSGFHHSIAHCLVSLETECRSLDAFRREMTAKILEHAISELSDSKMNLCFPEDELPDRPPSSSYNVTVSDWVV